ncbi:CopD family protein [Rhodoblastus sp.]|uniref:CopD family protein n=1 Tax=Rhodoblastus sp. TaxID=1962975 RepID=UPI0025DEA6C7|nr:CopD family protein [Rhodoblastus sp.]
MSAAYGSEAFPILPLLVLARWVHFGSVFILFGAPLFWLGMEAGFFRARHATDGLLRWAAPVAAASGLVWVGALVANMAGGFDRLFDRETLTLFFFQTEFGPVAFLRLFLLGGAVAVAASPGAAWRAALMGIGAFLLVDQAWLGHAAEGGAGLWGALMILAYSAHVLAGAAWLGGLPPLFFVLQATQDRGEAEEAGNPVAALTHFSILALPAVTLILISGVANVAFRVGSSLHALFLADYGYVLCAKAALVAAMLALACYNRFVALPRLHESHASGAGALAKTRASVGCELALGLFVLGAAALLGVTPPPQ